MRSEAGAEPASSLDIASVRILRLAVGTALSLLFSQIVSWPLSFVAPVFTMLLLALPMPVIKPKAAIALVAVLAICAHGGLALLPFILDQRLVGIGLLSVALFHSFYFTARGGSAALGTFATIGLALTTSIGTVSIDAVLIVVDGLLVGAAAGIVFVWIAHAILPDSISSTANATQQAKKKADGDKPDAYVARRSAWRSLAIVMPIVVWFLLSSTSASYAAVLIKVSAMGQQAGLDQTRQAAKSLLMSTVIGGIGAVIGWQVLSVWPSVTMYALLTGLAGLLIGPRIFSGQGMQADGATWSYGFLTMLVILAPAVTDSVVGGSADAAFWSRLWMFILATLYAVAAVFVFDTLWPAKKDASES